MSDQEMNEINQQLGQSDVSKYVDKIMKSRELVRVRGLPKNIPGGLPVIENFPGGVAVKKARKAKRGGGGIEGVKVIDETKIVDIPTPPLGAAGTVLKRAIGVFPFVGTALKRGKKE